MHICLLVTTYKYLCYHLPNFLTHKTHLFSKLSLSMSVTYHLLFFVCIFLHACNARRLTTQHAKLMEKEHHFHIKDDEVDEFNSFPNHIVDEMNEGNNKRMETWLVPKKPRKRRSTYYQKVVKSMRKDSGALQTNKSHASSVSWHVPHKKTREKDPGFNLDYSPPKTHPPSHN